MYSTILSLLLLTIAHAVAEPICSAGSREPTSTLALPQYPESARWLLRECTAYCRVRIDEQGRVSLRELAGFTAAPGIDRWGVSKEFREAIESALHQWRFRPGGPAELAVTFEFRLHRGNTVPPHLIFLEGCPRLVIRGQQPEKGPVSQ